MEPLNEEDIKMYFYENRLKTFEGWPFDKDCSCTPENVSERLKRLTFINVNVSLRSATRAKLTQQQLALKQENR